LALAGQARRPLAQPRQAFQSTFTVMDQVEAVGTQLLILHADAEAVVEILLRIEVTPLLTVAADNRTGPVAAPVAAAVGAHGQPSGLEGAVEDQLRELHVLVAEVDAEWQPGRG